MQQIQNFLLKNNFECVNKYALNFGGAATEYFHCKNKKDKITIVENVDNIQLLIYYDSKLYNYVAPKATEHALNKLKEVIV